MKIKESQLEKIITEAVKRSLVKEGAIANGVSNAGKKAANWVKAAKSSMEQAAAQREAQEGAAQQQGTPQQQQGVNEELNELGLIPAGVGAAVAAGQKTGQLIKRLLGLEKRVAALEQAMGANA